MIRILHVIDSLDLGGGQTALLNFARFADRSQFHLEVATMHRRGVFWEPFEQLSIPVYSLSPHRWLPLYIPRLIHLLRHGHFHIVHCHLNAANWIAKPIAAACGVPIRIAHDQCNDKFRSNHPALVLLDALTNRLSSTVLAVSTSTRDFLLSREDLDPSQVLLFPNAVDTKHFHPVSTAARAEAKQQLGFEADCFLVAGAGRLVPQKDFSTFLSAFSLFSQQRPNSRFAIAGTGPEEVPLRHRAAELGVANLGCFLGFLADPRLLYQACDVFLLPSLYEGLPLTALEAMSSGIPVVASAVDGLREVIRSGENGLLASAKQPTEFAAFLLRLHDSPAERSRIADAARTHIQAHYDARTLVQQLERLYLKTLLPTRAL